MSPQCRDAHSVRSPAKVRSARAASRRAATLGTLFIAGLLSGSACSDGPTAEQFTALSASADAAAPVPSAIQLVSGGGQTAPAGTKLSNDIVVRAVAKNGTPMGGIVLDFVAGSGSGSFAPANATTASDGTARSSWTLGPSGGTHTATIRPRKGGTTLTVTAAATEACLAIAPASASLTSFGVTFQLTPVTTRTGTVAWATSNEQVATVSNTGLVTAVSNGAVTITATLVPCLPATATVDVAQALASVTTLPAADSIQVGQNLQLSATAKDANNNTMTGVSFTWTSDNTGVATVNAAGLATGIGVGSARVIATAGGKADTSVVTVLAPPAAIASAVVTPDTASIQAGGTVQLTAVAKDTAGATLTGVTFSWSSSDSAVAVVDAAGLVTGVAAGSVFISASTAGKSDSATITVTEVTPPPAVVATVTTTPDSAALSVGGTVQLMASARDADGATIDGVSFTWASGNGDVATVTSTGLVTGVAAGSADIIASVDGISDTTRIAVNAPPASGGITTIAVSPAAVSITAGKTTQLSATARDANGTVVNGVTFAWASDNPAVASVNASGVVTAVAAGSTSITAAASGQTGSAGVTVTAGTATVATVTIDPASPTVATNQTVQLGATAWDANGAAIIGAPINWESNNAAVASVNAYGLLIGASPGTATITARSGGRFGTATATVTPAAQAGDGSTVASITVSPASQSVEVGQTVQLIATARDAGGAVVGNVSFTWTSSSAGVAAVDSNGMLTGAALGAATVTASVGGKAGSADVTVDPETTSGGGDPASFATIRQGIRPRGFGAGTYSLEAPIPGRRAYYVATGGNDGNAGTMSAPFRTINKAAQVAIAGDVVVIGDGTYHESIILPGSGTASAPIVFQAQNRGGVVLTGRQYTVQPYFYIGSVGNTPHRYYTFKGLVFRGYATNATNGVAVRAFWGWAIEDCLFDDSGETGVAIIDSNIRIERTTFMNHFVHAFNVYGGYSSGTSPDDPAYRPVENLLIRDVVLHNNHTRNMSGAAELSTRVVKIAVSRGTIVDNVESYENYGSGMWFDNKNSNYVVRNSYFHHNRGVMGPNGTVALDAGRGLYIEKNWGSAVVENNVMQDNAGAGIVIVSSNDIAFDNNLLLRNEQAIQLLAVTGTGYENFLLRNIIFRRTYMKGWRTQAAVWARGGDFSLGPAGMNINLDYDVYDKTDNPVQLAAWPAPIYGAANIPQLQTKFGWEFNGVMATIAE